MELIVGVARVIKKRGCGQASNFETEQLNGEAFVMATQSPPRNYSLVRITGTDKSFLDVNQTSETINMAITARAWVQRLFYLQGVISFSGSVEMSPNILT